LPCSGLGKHPPADRASRRPRLLNATHFTQLPAVLIDIIIRLPQAIRRPRGADDDALVDTRRPVAAMQRVADWLNKVGLGQYAQHFADNAIDTSVLRLLTDQDLQQIGVALGHRKKILRAIAELDEAGLGLQPARQNEAGRRQLTVMFADLVGSTALSTKL